MSLAVKVLSSIWLLLAILLTLAGVLLWAMAFETDMEIGAIKKDFSKSLWFNGLIGLLGVNLSVCVLKRNPFKRKMWGYLITHVGIDTILIGAMISNLTMVRGSGNVVEGDVLHDIELEDRQEILIRTSKKEYSFEVAFNPYKELSPNKRLDLDTTNEYVTVKKYVPKASVASDTTLILSVISSNGNIKTYPVKKDTSTPLGMDERDPKWYKRIYFVDKPEKIQETFSKGKMLIKIEDKDATIDVGEYLDKPFSLGKYTITIKKLETHFRGSFQPGLTFNLTADQKTVERECPSWKDVPVRDPDGKEIGRAQLKDCFMLRLTILRAVTGLVYAINNLEEKKYIKQEDVKYGEIYDLSSDSKFQIDEIVETGELIKSASDPMASPAILLESNLDGTREERWYGLHDWSKAVLEQLFDRPNKKPKIVYRPLRYKLPFSLRLIAAEETKYPGSDTSSIYRSKVIVNDEIEGVQLRREIEVNKPLVYKGFTFYQARMDAFGQTLPVPWSGFEVAMDHGKPIIYIGCAVAVLGVILMFYLKKYV